MVEQFSTFVQEALEFLSLLRASEKERFEAEKKFMAETTKILKELAESIKKNNDIIKTSLDDLKKSVSSEIKKIEEKIGVNTLNKAIDALESSVDLLQKGSTMLDYKFTIQKVRDMLDDINKSKIKTEIPPSPAQPIASSPSSGVLTKDSSAPALAPQPAIPLKKAPPSPSPPSPSEPPQKSLDTSIPENTPKTSVKESNTPTFQKVDPLAAAMGTRAPSRPPRRVVELKKAPQTKIVARNGEPIEIETGSDEDE